MPPPALEGWSCGLSPCAARRPGPEEPAVRPRPAPPEPLQQVESEWGAQGDPS